MSDSGIRTGMLDAQKAHQKAVKSRGPDGGGYRQIQTLPDSGGLGMLNGAGSYRANHSIMTFK